ncbi:hypothetical protein C8R46DRAFT_1233028 [Mycena filopes]|nr:hypothetical protein C8R46DRAFT_1233028 [Mycena filopes]
MNTCRSMVLYMPLYKPLPTTTSIQGVAAATAPDDEDDLPELLPDDADDVPELLSDADYLKRIIGRILFIAIDGSFRLPPRREMPTGRRGPDLHAGEPYRNMDYIFLSASPELRSALLSASWDSVCQAQCKCSCHKAPALTLAKL